MKAILVLTGGGETDRAVLDTALAAAKPLGAHLECLHVRVSTAQAAMVAPHVDFAIGAGLRHALDHLKLQSELRSAAAASHFLSFCQEHEIKIADAPIRLDRVSASWREERDDAVQRATLRARHNDLAVLARPSRPNGLPPNLIETLVLDCGRPILLAPLQPRHSLTGSVLVCWKETASAARALAAALPLLAKARRVVIVGVEEGTTGSLEELRDVARLLCWHGINAETAWRHSGSGSAADEIVLAAAEYDADLLVMGGYGHGRAREVIFGGCTQRFLEHAERPLLIMH
jgi:nucleotide-binding universal stress UspA family protein